MLDALSKSFFHALARSKTLEGMASRIGMAKPTSFARRFIAGETAEEAIEAARAIQARGLLLTLDQLGESITTLAEAEAATTVYLALIEKIRAAGIDRNISLKPTQLGLDIDQAVCVDNITRILDVAAQHDFFVRIDMENTPYIQKTLDMFSAVWSQGFRNAGVVLQSAVFRSEDDARAVSKLGARVRLVKGAYKEPAALAHQAKADVDAGVCPHHEGAAHGGHLPGHRHARPGDDRGDEGVCRRAGHPEGRLRVPDALRHPARPAGAARRRGLPDARLRPLRQAVVPLLHAPPRRAPGQRRVRGEGDTQ